MPPERGGKRNDTRRLLNQRSLNRRLPKLGLPVPARERRDSTNENSRQGLGGFWEAEKPEIRAGKRPIFRPEKSVENSENLNQRRFFHST